MPCPKGTYNPLKKSFDGSDCILCPPGTFNIHTGESICQDCGLGTYNIAEGSSGVKTCGVCEYGFYCESPVQKEQCPFKDSFI